MVIIIITICIIFLCFLPAIINAVREKNSNRRVQNYPDSVRVIYDKLRQNGGDAKKALVNAGFLKQADYFCQNVIIIDGYIMFKYSNSWVDYMDCIPIHSCRSFVPTETDVKRYKGQKTVKDTSSNKSVVGNAVVGGIVAGGVGAVVGAIAASDNNARHAGDTKTVSEYNKESCAAIFCSYNGKEHTIPCEYDR